MNQLLSYYVLLYTVSLKDIFKTFGHDPLLQNEKKYIQV